jgi:tRNA pseudouridine38-40 synthase
MAACFIGEHDFTSFSSPDEERRTTVRRISASSFFVERNFLVYQITGNAFLWKMVRSIIGTLLELEAAGSGRKEVSAILESMDRREAGSTAPPWGLFLRKVSYEVDENEAT